MINNIQARFALSKSGAKSLVKGIIFSTILNIALMLPAVFVFMFLTEYLQPVIDPQNAVSHGVWHYLLIGLVFILITFLIARVQYRNTFINVYNESAMRRIALAETLRKLPLAFFGEKNLSDLTSTVMDDNTQMESMFSHAVPQLFAALISTVLIATGVFFYNWQLALSLFWVVPVAATIVLYSRKKQNRVHSDHYRVKRNVTETIQEGIEMIQEIKSYNQEAKYLQDLQAKLDKSEKSQIKSEVIPAAFLISSQMLLKLGLASVVIVGANLLASGSITMLTYLIFLMISATVYNPILEVFTYLSMLAYLDVRIDRLKEINRMPTQQGKTEYSVDNYDIVFDNVNFAYEEGKQVLENVSFTAKQGEVTALVGPSGGGKSTATKLAARFWDIDGGKITLGGEDISQIDSEALLRNYSVVFQDVVLFNASVTENIRIGRKDATEADIKRVAKLAQCDEFISRLPQGYDTVLGENGETLSGGERQRISIARALLKDAPIVLLDEATASVDVENETKIQAGISELTKNKTVIIIAHRMRTVANADKIVVLKDGKVAEQGAPAELLSKKGEFAKMVEKQKEWKVKNEKRFSLSYLI